MQQRMSDMEAGLKTQQQAMARVEHCVGEVRTAVGALQEQAKHQQTSVAEVQVQLGRINRGQTEFRAEVKQQLDEQFSKIEGLLSKRSRQE